MSRGGFWASGFALGAAVCLLIPEEADDLVRFLAFGLGFVVPGLAGEVLHCLKAPGPRRSAPPGAKPADGVVEIEAVAGVWAVPLEFDPRWSRFESVDRSDPTRHPARPGPCPPLLGRIAVVSLFVGRDGRSWSDAEIASVLREVERAGRWIEREAMRYGAPVDVALAATVFAADDPADEGAAELAFVEEWDGPAPFEAEAPARALASASRAAAALGFADAAALVAAIDPRVRADARAWLLHPLRAGRSIAIRGDDGGLPGVDLAVCYPREADFPGPLLGPARGDATTIAHELLHLFGASDKYHRPRDAYPAGSVSPREVMRLDTDRLGRLRVDRLTAAELGWPASSKADG